MLNKLRKEQGFTLIELLIVVAIIGILAAIAIPQFASYRQKGFNGAATADIKNCKTGQESLFADYQSYGQSDSGVNLTAIPAVTGGAGKLVSGPMVAASASQTGAYIAGNRASDGSTVGVGIALSNGVNFIANTIAPVAPALNEASYMMFTKHTQGTREFGTEDDTTAIYYVQNDTWAGTALDAAAAPATPPAADTSGKDDFNALPGGGAPIKNWSAM